MEMNGARVRRQGKIAVYFQGQIIGEYFAGLLFENDVLVELKAASPDRE